MLLGIVKAFPASMCSPARLVVPSLSKQRKERQKNESQHKMARLAELKNEIQAGNLQHFVIGKGDIIIVIVVWI